MNLYPHTVVAGNMLRSTPTVQPVIQRVARSRAQERIEEKRKLQKEAIRTMVVSSLATSGGTKEERASTAWTLRRCASTGRRC